MYNLLEFYQNDMNREKWEDLCNEIYKLKYQDIGYHYVPSRHEGDCGIEGYTDSGIVYQCYYPDKDYSPNELYEKYRKKMTTDLAKLIEYEKKLYSIGVTNIKEWHFIIPSYIDKRILAHKTAKTKELLDAKSEGKISIIDDNFKILIKDTNDFKEELCILTLGTKKYKVTLPVIALSEIDWQECPTEMTGNIKRKIAKLLNIKEGITDVEGYNRLVQIYIEFYMKGIKTLNIIEKNSPALYERVISLENTCRADVEIKCLMNNDKSINRVILQDILSEFGNKIKDECGIWLREDGIGALKQEIVAKWLADCPLDFVE